MKRCAAETLSRSGVSQSVSGSAMQLGTALSLMMCYGCKQHRNRLDYPI